MEPCIMEPCLLAFHHGESLRHKGKEGKSLDIIGYFNH